MTDMTNLPMISDNSRLSTFLLEIKQYYNPLVPEMLNFVKPELKLGFQKISIDTTFGKYRGKDNKEYTEKSNKDIYSVDGGKYALHLGKQLEIGQAYGFKIVASKVMDRVLDDSGRVLSIKHAIWWKHQSIDGAWNEGVTTGEYNYEEDKNRFSSETQVNKRRNFAGALAESNATSRAILKAIPKLAGSYTLEELKKPFLVPRVIEDVSDLLKKYPDLERAYIAQKLNMSMPVISSQGEIPATLNPTMIGALEAEAQPINDDDDTATTTVQDMSPAEKNSIFAKEYLDQPENVRIAKVKELLLKKGKSWTGTKPVEQCSAKEQVQYIEALLNLPDAPTKGDGLPFN